MHMHACRYGAGSPTQHAIYVGETDGRTLICFQRVKRPDGRRAVSSRLSYTTFDKFRSGGDVYRIEYGVLTPKPAHLPP